MTKATLNRINSWKSRTNLTTCQLIDLTEETTQWQTSESGYNIGQRYSPYLSKEDANRDGTVRAWGDFLCDLSEGIELSDAQAKALQLVRDREVKLNHEYIWVATKNVTWTQGYASVSQTTANTLLSHGLVSRERGVKWGSEDSLVATKYGLWALEQYESAKALEEQDEEEPALESLYSSHYTGSEIVYTRYEIVKETEHRVYFRSVGSTEVAPHRLSRQDKDMMATNGFFRTQKEAYDHALSRQRQRVAALKSRLEVAEMDLQKFPGFTSDEVGPHVTDYPTKKRLDDAENHLAVVLNTLERSEISKPRFNLLLSGLRQAVHGTATPQEPKFKTEVLKPVKPETVPVATKIVRCCPEPMVRGGCCDNCATWIGDLLDESTAQVCAYTLEVDGLEDRSMALCPSCADDILRSLNHYSKLYLTGVVSRAVSCSCCDRKLSGARVIKGVDAKTYQGGYDNYMEGVIENPDEVCRVGGNTLARVGERWADVHPPNGSNLIGVYGIRWWKSPAECAELNDTPARRLGFPNKTKNEEV